MFQPSLDDHTLLALLELALLDALPEVVIHEKGTFQHGFFLAVSDEERTPQEIFLALEPSFLRLLAEQPNLQVMEMVPESANALWDQVYPGEEPPHWEESEEGLVTLIRHQQRLITTSSPDLTKSLNGLLAKLLPPQQVGDLWIFSGVAGRSAELLQKKSAYFLSERPTSYMTIGAAMQLWQEGAPTQLLPKGYKLMRRLERAIEESLHSPFHWVQGWSTEELQKAPFAGGYQWGIKEFFQKEGFYLPHLSQYAQADLFFEAGEAVNQLISCLQFNREITKIFGLGRRFYLRVGKRKKKSSGGQLSEEKVFQKVLDELGESYEQQDYPYRMHPRVDVYLVDRLHREWPLATLSAKGLCEDKSKLHFQHTLVHGIEQLMFIGLEHCQGNLPFALLPEHLRLIPVRETNLDWVQAAEKELRQYGIQASIDLNFQRLQNRVLAAEKHRVPFVAIVGDKEQSKDLVALRPTKGKKTFFTSVKGAAEKIYKMLESKNPEKQERKL